MSFTVRILGRNGSLHDRMSSNSSLMITSEDGNILVDCSANIQEAVNIGHLDAVILTHEHVDHVFGIPSLIHQLWLSGRSDVLPIYAPPSTCEIVSKFIDLFSFEKKRGMFPIEISQIDSFSIRNMRIDCFHTDHTVESIGIVVRSEGKKLIYTSDTRPITAISPIMESPDLLITEASGIDSSEEALVKKGHQSGKDAAELALNIKAKQLVLVHLPSSDSSREGILREATGYFRNTKIPEPLEGFEL